MDLATLVRMLSVAMPVLAELVKQLQDPNKLAQAEKAKSVAVHFLGEADAPDASSVVEGNTLQGSQTVAPGAANKRPPGRPPGSKNRPKATRETLAQTGTAKLAELAEALGGDNGKARSMIMDAIESAAGKGVRKIKDVPDDKCEAVEQALSALSVAAPPTESEDESL